MQPIFLLNPKWSLDMLSTIITSTPIYVCSILSILLGLSLAIKWDRARYRLMMFMVTATMFYIGHFAFYNRTESVVPITDTLYCFSYPAIFPLILIYIEGLVQKDPSYKRALLYLLPAFACGISAGLIYATISEESLEDFMNYHFYYQNYNSLTGAAWWLVIIHRAARVIFTLEIPFVLYFGWKYINEYNKMVENYYSNTEDKVVTFIKPLMIAFVATSIASFISNFVSRNYFTESIWLLAIPALLFSSIILLFGFVGITQNIYTREIVEESITTEGSEQEIIPLTPEKSNIMAKEIKKLMDEKQLFLQPNLKINDLASMLNTNRNYIYNAINQGIGMSFAEYINKKRIEYAVQLIDQDREILLTDVAHQSGFSSPSAFYRNFKLYMDCTPSDYQKRGASIAASTLSK
jgi:AraC-like DNA-binding protein